MFERAAVSMLFFTKLGAASAHQLIYLFIIWQFDSTQNSFVFASCNLVARLITVIAPIVSELDEPLPMALFSGLSLASAILCYKASK